MKTIRLFFLILFICVLFLLTSCIVKDSPAPGCIEYIGFAPIGGCNGKTILTDLTLKGFPECIQVSVNNCNGGVLEVQNNCSEVLTLATLKIPSGESFNLDIQPASESGFDLVRTPSNFSNYIPTTDQTIEITGSIGDGSLFLSLIKTAPLCD